MLARGAVVSVLLILFLLIFGLLVLVLVLILIFVLILHNNAPCLTAENLSGPHGDRK